MANKQSCCSGKSNCCAPGPAKKVITIDFLYLDLSVCTRCNGTDESLEQALSEVGTVLRSTGAEVVVHKINVINEELAFKHRFLSSPTIRVNGKDIQLEIKESTCESCGDLCGEDVDCRIWVYQGAEYTAAPKAMIIEAILKEVFGGSAPQEEKPYVLPENLRKYYAAMQNK